MQLEITILTQISLKHRHYDHHTVSTVSIIYIHISESFTSTKGTPETFQRKLYFTHQIPNENKCKAWFGSSGILLYVCFNALLNIILYLVVITGHTWPKGYVWSSQDNLWNSALIFYHVGPRGWTILLSLPVGTFTCWFNRLSYCY